MKFKTIPLDGGLYLIATPIGTARDITLRALDVFASADVLVAEDTRTLRKLLDIHGIALSGRPLVSYHDHSSAHDRQRVEQFLQNGSSVAYASEAGTPLIADPGFKLVKIANEIGVKTTALPGPSAAITALVLAEQPTDRFVFAGFLPTTTQARQKELETLLATQMTLVVYESPKRVAAFCEDLSSVAGPNHSITLCRELSKRFEEIDKTTAEALANRCKTEPLKGEVVLVIAPFVSKTSQTDVDEAIRNALLTMRVKDAAETVAGAFGLPKRDVYQRALALQKDAK